MKKLNMGTGAGGGKTRENKAPAEPAYKAPTPAKKQSK